MAINQDPGSWDPIDTFVTFWGSVGSNLYDGLTMRGADLKLQPGLATKWEYLDDNKRLRFTLRQGVKFHNGEPFNAEAVKFTFDRLLGAEGAKGPQKSNYDSIGEVKVGREHRRLHPQAAGPGAADQAGRLRRHDRAAQVHPGKGRGQLQHPPGRHRPVRSRATSPRST